MGLSDDGSIEGFNKYGIDKFNEVQKCVNDYLIPAFIYKPELISVINNKGEEDKIILFHIEPSMDHIIKNTKGEVYCRMGDSSIKLTHDQITALEYDRKERNFETELVKDSSINDIDIEVTKIYKEKIGATDISDIDVLRARGYLKKYMDKLVFTNAGLLLFAKNPSLYLPCSRLRVLKFQGNDFQVGTQMNVIKEKTFDKNLYKIINESKDFINSQLREFSYLGSNGLFESHPEYPEFAWYEGIVNAVTHRDYSNSGEQIIVKIYDNRMEIKSPGKLGGFVTIDTITTERYSRNPIIARTLNEFGIVRKLNEGVKRIYSEMEDYNLNKPTYSEPSRNSVLLVLENNISEKQRILESTESFDNIEWNDLGYLEQVVIRYITNNNGATRKDISELIERSKTSTVKILNRLIDKNIIVWTGTSKSDNYGKYIIKK